MYVIMPNTIKGIIHLRFPSQSEMTHSMFRLSEYFESPFNTIREHYFSVKQFYSSYVNVYEEYFNYFEGFNIPLESILSFADKFNTLEFNSERNCKDNKSMIREHLMRLHSIESIVDWRWNLESEVDLIITENKIVNDVIKADAKYLIVDFIGADEDVLQHEICHAMYKLDNDYKLKIDSILISLGYDTLIKLSMCLLSKSYTSDNVFDEIHAYLITSTDDELIETFDTFELDEIKVIVNKFKGVL